MINIKVQKFSYVLTHFLWNYQIQFRPYENNSISKQWSHMIRQFISISFANFFHQFSSNKYIIINNIIIRASIIMIKSIIEKIMIKEFSKYINGIEYNKLTVQVLGGYFGIENISLNHGFFNSLETPLKVTYSHIGKLSIEAPLTKLSSVPVSCTIEDVYVIAEHKKNIAKINEISKEELLQKYIKETFDALVDKIKESKKEDGMLDKLGKKILDNLKLQIKNIHIRFEQSNELHTYSFGVSLKSLTFGTTDKNWKSIFVQRQKEKEEEPIFKCMTIQNFKLYWQSISTENKKEFLFLRLASDNLKIESMRKFVTNDSDSIFNINSTVKLKINPTTYTTMPLFELVVELEPINIKFSKQKIVQILDFTTSCIKYNEVMLKTLLDKALKKLTHDQEKKYKPICSKFVQYVLDKQKDKKKQSKETPFTKQFKQLFQNIAIEHLYELSMSEIKLKIQEHRQKQIKKEKKSWFSSAEVQLTSQEKKEVQKLLNELIEDSVAKGRPQQSILLKLIFNLKGLSFMFYDESNENKLKKIELSIQNIACVLEKSHNKSYFAIQNKIKKIVADLTIQQDKSLQKIHLMQNICEGQNQYLIQFIYRESVSIGKKTIINYFSDLTLRKTLFTYKKQYWKMFNSFFSLPQINQQVQNEAMGKLELLKKESSQDEGEQIQIQQHYNINLNLNSPSFILPLSATTYWYLDLGKITMKSETHEKKFIYPFKLTQLNMRYISKQEELNHTQSLLKSKEFFPIIKNINVQVNMITLIGKNIVEFQILLDQIQLNATREQFINLMNVKKFLVGQEKDQIQIHKEQVKNKEDLIKKKRLEGKILKRNKYFYNWIQFYCLLSNNSLLLYPAQKDLIPESIIALRGVKINKNIQQNESILEITSNGETFYLQFKDNETLQLWESEIIQNLHELKDFHSLILQGNLHEHKPKKKKKEDLVNVHLRLNSMDWNYLNEKGQQFLKIQLKKIQLTATEKEDKVETQFYIEKIQIIDKIFEYSNKKYQHLFIASKLLLKISKAKESVTKINPTTIGLNIKTFDVNWKPDALLLIIQSVKQFLQIKPIVINKDITRKEIIEGIKNDDQFNTKMEKYDSLSKDSIKTKRQSYLKMNEKDDQIYIKFTVEVQDLNVNFIHRQSHIPMFLLISKGLITNVTTGKVQKFVDGSIETFEFHEITGYPQQKYDINVDYEPYCLIRKKQTHKSKSFIEFKYSSYQPDQIANKQRVDSFLSISFTPVSLHYIQEVVMRLIDYFLIQIVLLLNHSQVITVNQDVLKQIMSNSSIKNQKPKNFLENQFQLVIKRLFYPFFMDYIFEFELPEIILEPIKNNGNYFNVAFQSITIENTSLKKNHRFSNIKYEFSDKIYEEQIIIKGQNIVINSINKEVVTNLVNKPFNLSLVVNRLLFEDQINEITPQIIGYDRSLKIENIISAIQITEISKYVYQNLLRLPNFNLNYEDGNNELFIHNYRITKTLSPKPIRYKLKIEQVSFLAKHSLDQIKEVDLKLWSIAFHNFQLEMRKDEKLNSMVQINFQQANASIYEYPDLNNISLFQIKELAKIHNIKNNNNYAIIKLPNNGIIDIQTCLESCQFNLNFGVLPLIADWVQPDDSVFAISTKQDKLINFLIRLPKVVVNLQDESMFGQHMKMVGELIIQVTRKNGESYNYLRNGYFSKEIHPNYIEQLNNFMSMKINLGLQFFTRFNNRDRKILQKAKIEMKEEYYYRIRNDDFRKTVRRRLNISELRGSVSVDDIILFKSVLKCKDKGEIYEKQFKSILKQTFIKSEKDLEKSIYKDLLDQQKMLQEFVFNIQTIKFYLVHKQKTSYIPILRICTNKISILQFVNKQNQVYNGELDIQAYYFNDQIFRWQPFIENTKIKLTLTNDLQVNKFLQAEISNQIYINASSEMAVSIKKALQTTQEKIQQYNEGNYVPEEGQEYQSRYIICNQTGYPIQIYDDTHKSQFFIMTGDSINYFTKKLQENFFEQNQIKQTFSFIIHHPSYEMLEVTNISLESQKSFDIELYDTKGRKLPDHCKIYLENWIDGWKKILTIRSKKYISDYSDNTLIKKFLPFDIEPSYTFTEGTHKGIKANFFTKCKSQRFFYNGVQGNLIIRKSALVYNYTVIPLNVNDSVVIPGEFVGINGPLTIQGMPYKESFLKVSYNEAKQQYYIYSISYIIDYTGLYFSFDEQYEIKQLYTYQFKQNGKIVRVYLLPDINFEFRVKYSKNSSVVKLKGKLARQQFQITSDNSMYTYACFSHLESFCKNNIKEFKKIIEITNAYQFCNDTTQTLLIRQIDTIQKQKIILKPGENTIFNWSNKFLRELVQITIIDEKQEWLYASPLPIIKNIDTFIIRNKKTPENHKIYCLQIEQTNNLQFIHILNSDTRYQICNELSNVRVTLYQTAIFETKDTDFISKDVDPSIYTYTLPPKSKKYFGFQLPIHSHHLTIHFESTTNQQQTQYFAIDDIEKNVIEKNLQLFKTKQKASIKLQFNKKNKRLKFYVKRKEIFKKEEELQAKIKIKAIYLGLIGIHDGIRKEIINACFNTINLHFITNNQYIQQCLQIQNIRIENIIKPEPYFITLFNQEEDQNKLAMKFILRKSRYNPNLIYNIAFSMRKSIVTVTSQELQILEENVNKIMQKVNAKSDTNFLINFDDIFKPSKIVNHSKLYFVQAQLHPLKFIMTYKHVNNWGGALLKALSINNCKMTVNGKKISNFDSHDLLDFFSIMGKYFKQQFQSEIFSMIGSLGLLGSPLNLASKIGCGLQNLIELPADGFEDEGFLGVGKGLALGTGSLISNTVQGAFGSVQSITGAIGQGISGLASYDKKFEKTRQQLKNQRVDHVGEGLVSGGKSIFNGIFTGITGLVTQPIKGAEKGGIGGFFKGGFKGITGLIVKPVSGVIDATSKTAEGIKNTTKVFSKQTKQSKTRRYNPRPFYGYNRQVKPYDAKLAQWNKEIGLYAQKYGNLSWVNIFQMKNGQLVILTYEYLLIVDKKQFDIRSACETSSILSITAQNERITVIARNNQDQKEKFQLQPKEYLKFNAQLFKVYNHFNKNYQIGIDRKATIK